MRSLCPGLTRAYTKVSQITLSRALSVSLSSSAPVTARPAVRGDIQLSGDSRGRPEMVAGDHYGADAGAPGEIDRISHLFARGIYHADETHEHQVLLDVIVDLYPLLLERERTEGDAEGA